MLLNRGVLAAFLHHLRKGCVQPAPVKPSRVLHTLAICMMAAYSSVAVLSAGSSTSYIHTSPFCAVVQMLSEQCPRIKKLAPCAQAKNTSEDKDLDMPDAPELTQASQVSSSSASHWTDCALGLHTLARAMGDLNLEEQDGTLQDIIEACTGLLKASGIPGVHACRQVEQFCTCEGKRRSRLRGVLCLGAQLLQSLEHAHVHHLDGR